MGSANLKAKIKRGLAKAIKATGSTSSDKVYVVQVVAIAGSTPLDDIQKITTNIELVNAIFKKYDKYMIVGGIVSGDRQLITDNEVEIKTGDTIIQGSISYTVISLGIVAPTSDRLLYTSQLRVK